MMKSKHLTPSPKYLTKMRVTMVLLALAIILSGALLGFLLSFTPDIGRDGAVLTFKVTAVLNIIWLVPALLLSGPYYRSLAYEIENDEVIVRAGIVTKSVKHVPYRTVTNITIRRGILDRWLFGLGTLIIQTAGMSGSTGAEEVLIGLDDVQNVYDLVVEELRRFRGSMAPTAAEEILDGTSQEAAGYNQAWTGGMLDDILVELRTIRKTLESQS